MNIKRLLKWLLVLVALLIFTEANAQTFESLPNDGAVITVGPLYLHGVLLADREFSVEIFDLFTPRLSFSEIIQSDSQGYLTIEPLAFALWNWRLGCTPYHILVLNKNIVQFGEGEYKDQCINLPLITLNSFTINAVNESRDTSIHIWGGSIALIPER